MPLDVLAVASEVFPLIKTGGLADVAGALPEALRHEGIRVRTVLPGYPAVLRALADPTEQHGFNDLFGGTARLLAAVVGGLELLVLDAPHLYDRGGGPYADANAVPWPDNAIRFAALGRVAAELGRGLLPDFAPAIVHAHDWQAGLAPAYLYYAGEPRPGLVMTVHNIAYQGQFPAGLLTTLGLPRPAYSVNGVEYYGSIGYLKAGLWCADRITTVSPTYATEIMTDEGGMGLGGLLRARASVVSGILNGIDTDVWNPLTDSHLPATYDASSLTPARARNKRALQERFALTQDPDALLFGVVGRLEWLKGLDLLLQTIPDLLSLGAQLALIGTGDRSLQHDFVAACHAHPDRVGVIIGYDERLAHLIQGGSDAIVVPSRFEPCGLTQLCALHYGALPVVARVGGLNDTIIDANEAALTARVATGVQFHPVTAEHLAIALTRTAAFWRDHVLWRRMQQNAMATDVSWNRAARRYATIYRELVEARRG
jgi:starch synthase